MEESNDALESKNVGGKLPKIYYPIIILFVVVLGYLIYISTKKEAAEDKSTNKNALTQTPFAEEVDMNDFKKYSGITELVKEDSLVGSGDEAKAGNTVVVHYTGYLTDGSKFDSSVERGAPFSFILGQGTVIQGWEEGVLGMKVGGKRRLAIPPDMGYGNQSAGSIPANSVLVFDIELLKVE